jgi:DKNYY family protein
MSKRIAAAAMFTIILTGCGGYRKSQGQCVFVTYDEGRGRVEHPLAGADPRSFRVLVRDEYARDATHVYHRNQWMTDADARSFEVVRGTFVESLHGAIWAKDARHVWLGDAPVRGAQPATFRPLRFPYSRDAVRVFCGTEAMSADPATFEILTSGDGTRSTSDDSGRTTQVIADSWSRDARSCFYGPAIVARADPASFQPLGDYYAKDRTHVFYGSAMIPNADAATFTADGIIGKDKAHRYVAARITP